MANSSTSPSDVFNVKKIRQLVQLMKEHGLTEVDLEQGEQRIRLRRGDDNATQVAAPAVAPVAVAAPAVAAPGPATADNAAAAAGSGTEENIKLITSPIVGTYYSSPSPEAAAYVKVGDHVGLDTTVCIVEAMKVFNEIQAEVSGKIVAVLIENGDPVEYGQPLFRVDVSA